ncbi:MAG: hypothetical protein H6670_02870 [Anaerolineaceae bacterium]|nr:hypothetical protein [Anaerolineaceae bacterium]
MKRSKVTSRSKAAQRDRLPCIHQHGLTIALSEVLKADKKVAIRIKIPGNEGSEYWFKDPTDQAMREVVSKLGDILIHIVPNAKLIVDDSGASVCDEEFLRKQGIEIKCPIFRW